MSQQEQKSPHLHKGVLYVENTYFFPLGSSLQHCLLLFTTNQGPQQVKLLFWKDSWRKLISYNTYNISQIKKKKFISRKKHLYTVNWKHFQSIFWNTLLYNPCETIVSSIFNYRLNFILWYVVQVCKQWDLFPFKEQNSQWHDLTQG